MPDSFKRKIRILGIKPRDVSLWVADHDHPTIIHCMFCGHVLGQTYKRVIGIMPGMTPHPMPITIFCPNTNCGTNWHIHTIV